MTVDCLKILQKADKPLTAIQIATMLYLPGNRESQRRRVRAIIEQLRLDGHWIIANLQDGYWLTDDYRMWRHYIEGWEISAKQILADVGKKKMVATQREGSLFPG